MLWYTHISFGLLVGLLFLRGFDVNGVVFVALTMIGSLLPDIDHEGSKINKIFPVTRWFALIFTHRGFFHSVFPPAILYLGFTIAGTEWAGIALAVGYMTHLLSDGLTKMGVNLLHPASTLHIKGFIETGGVMELVVFGLVLGLSVFMLWGMIF